MIGLSDFDLKERLGHMNFEVVKYNMLAYC